MPQPIDIAWAAGFFDGEGCISIIRSKARHKFPEHTLRLSVGQVYPEPLLKLREMFGGYIYITKAQQNKRALGTWYIYNQGASSALEGMLPFLTVKKPQAIEAMRFAEHKSTLKTLLTSDDITVREDFKNKLHVLKGVAADWSAVDATT